MPGLLLALPAGEARPGTALFPDPAIIYEDGVGYVLAVDLNLDGIADLAVATGVGEKSAVAIRLGRGDGTFSSESRFPTGDLPSYIAIGDFNDDLLPDLAVANPGYTSSDGDLSVLLGAGGGAFSPAGTYAVGHRPWSVAVGDFDEDGRQDLIVVDLSSVRMRVLLGNGDGTFARPVPFDIPFGTDSVAIGRFNSDPHDDLVMVAGYRGVQMLLGRGDGTFLRQPFLASEDRPIFLLVSDFDANGHDDLAVANSGSLDVSVLLGLGDLIFKPQLRYPVGGAEFMIADDLDRDGAVDLAVVDFVTETVSTHLGQGDGRFEERQRFTVGQPLGVAFADFDTDGRLDLVQGTSHLVIFRGRGDGSFIHHEQLKTGGGPQDVIAGDISMDGHDDLAIVNGASNDVSIFHGTGRGTFLPMARLDAGGLPKAATLADLDADARPDLIVVNTGPVDLSVFFGTGGGFAPAGARVPVGDVSGFGSTADVVSADFNLDGAADLAVALSIADDVLILPGRGDGTFSPPIRLGLADRPMILAAGDFDGNAIPDLAVTTWNTRILSIHLGLGDGRFARAAVYDLEPRLGVRVYGMAVTDFDGDGIQDLAVGDCIRLGEGGGRFSPQSCPDRLDTLVNAVSAGDLNGDGRPDLAMATPYDYVSLFLGLGDGAFLPEQRFAAGNVPRALAAGDFNKDGRPDLVVANERSDEASILLNQGPLINRPPAAAAGPDLVVECESPGGAGVILDGSGSSDPDTIPGSDNDILAFQWYEDYGLPSQAFLGAGQRLPVALSLGSHRITLRIADGAAAIDTDDLLVHVVDTTPPSLGVSLSRTILWPPDHRMVEIEAVVESADLCGLPEVILREIASDEPDDAPGTGDGRTVRDISDAETGTLDLRFHLRAERAGGGDGREYTVVYEALDSSGNATRTASIVRVPLRVELDPPSD